MILTTDRYEIRSRNDNLIYWEQGIFPCWTALNAYRHSPLGAAGTGVEPHYHDNDEMWLFASGRGEAWPDGQRYEITPNTMVVTRLERQKRPIHVTVDEHGTNRRSRTTLSPVRMADAGAGRWRAARGGSPAGK